MRKALIFVLLAAALSAWAQDDDATEGEKGKNGVFTFETGATGYFGQFLSRPSLASDRMTVNLGAETGIVALSARVSADNSGKYPTHQSFELGHYFDMDEGKVALNLGWLKAYCGRVGQRDEIDSPYSLFISSNANPALCADIQFAISSFTYESRWIRLNKNSDKVYEGSTELIFDRGMEYKKYAVDLGAFHFGYQESSIYLFQDFSAEDFLSPVPVFVQQMALYSSGRPYSEKANPNSIMGFFCEYKTDKARAYGQLLIDDINASFLAPLLGWAIPALNSIEVVSKLGWNVGGELPTPYGKFGFHHGGATKYAFAATYTRTTNPDAFLPAAAGPPYSILPYEYCYYPFSAYSFTGKDAVVGYGDNYIGFKHGENALAFQLDYANGFFKERPYGFDAAASLEYVVNGSKSPNNPWHEYESNVEVGKAIALLDDPVLEHEVILRANARSADWKGWRFSLGFELGYVWNKLSLVAAAGHSDEAKIWTPIAGDDEWIAGIGLGVSYGFSKGF